MNLRSSALFVVVAAASLSCSSDPPPPTSGGAAFQLQNADSATATMLGLDSCNEASTPFVIAITGDDGKPKLVVDGADNAHVRCAIDATHFDISVSNGTASVAASGTYSGVSSTNASLLVTFGLNVSYSTKGAAPCEVTFTPNSAGSVVDEGGKIFAHFKCKALKNKTTANACGIDVSVTNNAYFQFSNCTGF